MKQFLPLPVISIFAALAFTSCAKEDIPATEVIQIAAGISPYADMAEQIGGDRVEAVSLIPPGKDPHTFDLDPRRLMNVNKAAIVVFNGAGLEMWADRIAEGLPDTTRIIWADRLLRDSLIAGGHAHSHSSSGHGMEGINPHFWLDPLLVRPVVAAIRDALIDADSVHADEYTRRADAYLARIDSLDHAIRDRVRSWERRSFVTTHSAWDYFCRRYGLRQARVLEAGPGQELSARDMKAAAEQMRDENIGVIFTQYMFPDAVARSLARETGARTAELDPHGSRSTSVHYIELMIYNMQTMNEAMQ